MAVNRCLNEILSHQSVEGNKKLDNLMKMVKLAGYVSPSIFWSDSMGETMSGGVRTPFDLLSSAKQARLPQLVVPHIDLLFQSSSAFLLPS
jgi:hypothetical protein